MKLQRFVAKDDGSILLFGIGLSVAGLMIATVSINVASLWVTRNILDGIAWLHPPAIIILCSPARERVESGLTTHLLNPEPHFLDSALRILGRFVHNFFQRH